MAGRFQVVLQDGTFASDVHARAVVGRRPTTRRANLVGSLRLRHGQLVTKSGRRLLLAAVRFRRS